MKSAKLPSLLLLLSSLVVSFAQAGKPDLPDLLGPWTDWATWEDERRFCPPAWNNPEERLCVWPSRLALEAGARSASWQVTVVTYAEAWMPLPGNSDIWPQKVTSDDAPIVVVEHDGLPAVKLPPGTHELAGTFAWEQMPQQIPIPKEIGLLTLTVDGTAVPLPTWDANGTLWLKRLRREETQKDLLAVQVYRILEDGLPLWLHTEIELTVSGKSREEDLGWILPEGWKLATVNSPIPVAIDEQGRTKAQVRAGKWNINLHAFRASDVREIRFAEGSTPLINMELIGFRARPELRLAELSGLKPVDVTQTTFPEKWRDLPVYQWATDTNIEIVEKMRGMGLQRPEGLHIERRFWLDEHGRGLTYRDTVTGRMQQIWRLDTADGQELGAVRVDGKGQLVTKNPATGNHGVEIRTRNLNLEAIGRIDSSDRIPATGWQSDSDSLKATLQLPPGWRAFAVFGADDVAGDWLTAWSLLDLFLLLIFGMAVLRLWGVPAGLLAFLAFGLAYHEPGAPRLTWLFLLIPIGLLQVVQFGTARRWIEGWKYVALALLLINLIPFLAFQIQGSIYPQLERPGVNYQERGMFRSLGFAHRQAADAARITYESEDLVRLQREPQSKIPSSQDRQSKFQSANLLYESKARIQTGPAEPEWTWNRVNLRWDGPVSADQQIRPVLIPHGLNRILGMVRVALLVLLGLILLRARKLPRLFSKHRAPAAAATLLATILAALPGDLAAQEIPDEAMLQKLRERLLEPSDAFPHAAEIATASLTLEGNRLMMDAEVHAAVEAAVPLPGQLPTWSPLTVTVDGAVTDLVTRKDNYLWVVLPAGVHRVVVEALLPDVPDWEWTFLLKPRTVTIKAPGWTVTGVRRNGVPEPQVFFMRDRSTGEGDASYDRKDFNAIVAVDRHLETGLVWQVRNEVTRLSASGKAVSIRIPLLAGERVLTSNVIVQNGHIEARLGANQKEFQWVSELPVGNNLELIAPDTEQWVERWHLVSSPVWNVTRSGLAPIFERSQQDLVPVWHPWPGELVTLTFNRPEAVVGETITVQRIRHDTTLGRRQRTAELTVELESSLGSDFRLGLDPAAEVSSIKVGGQAIPVRRDEGALIIPVQPGKQNVVLAWRRDDALSPVQSSGAITLPVNGANITTTMGVPESRWVLWTSGPRQGPAVRFWTILAFAIMAAWILGGLSLSPLKRFEWILLAIGLTQVHVTAGLLVVGWLFALAWRGRKDPASSLWWIFNLKQAALVLLTLIALGVLLVIVGAGLLGDPEMFIVGNGSSRSSLQWFQPRAGNSLPEPQIISVSVWFYRLFMLVWALWLATSLLRWLTMGWKQFSHHGTWKTKPRVVQPPQIPTSE